VHPDPFRLVVIALVWLAIVLVLWLRVRHFRTRRRGSEAKPSAAPFMRSALFPPDAAPQPGEPQLEFGFRGEDIAYRDGDREVDIAFTYGKGPRIFTDSIQVWKDGASFTDAQRREVLGRAVAFVRAKRERPIVVVNVDDAAAAAWMSICDELRGEIDSVETDSDAQKRAFLKKTLMGGLAAGKGWIVDGTRLSTEEEIDRHVERVYPPRSTDASE